MHSIYGIFNTKALHKEVYTLVNNSTKAWVYINFLLTAHNFMFRLVTLLFAF